MLRIRFLRRHPAPGLWAADIGSGPGRFLPHIGPEGCRRVALDLSQEMLLRIDSAANPSVHRVRGDGGIPPLARGEFANVAVLGNALGFAGRDSERLLNSAEELVAPEGRLLLEVVAGPGERSRYLHRLPPKSAARLLRSPVEVVYRRTLREGFAREPPRKPEEGEFRRFDPADLAERLGARGWVTEEILAVAPCLGASPDALKAVRSDEKGWGHVVELEERMGVVPDRWGSAAAVLLAFSRPPPTRPYD
ncbi:MAG: methyltransferase domain-containing protein [Thermoplasmata archaeon]